MMQPSQIPFRKRSGTTPVGMLGAAVVSVLLLCGAGNTPTGNLQTSDLNANGHAITNAANIATTNLNVSSAAALPANTTVGGTAVSQALSPVIYHTSTTCTSDAGALLNTSLASGASFSGVSDQTTALQAIFNHASTGTSIVVVWDGAYSTSAPITVYGNTRVIALHNCGLVLRNSANCPMFQNAHISTGSGSFGTITDYNISFDGGLWNGNAANQAHDTSTYGWTTGFKFWGVDTVFMDNMKIFDTRTFALHFANWKHVTTKNIKFYAHTSTSGITTNQDALHFNGPGYDLNVDGITSQTNDDTLAINADDGNATNFAPGYGPITGVYAHNIYLDGCTENGFRLLSAGDAIDQVSIDGVYGSTNEQIGIIDNGSPYSVNNPGNGAIGKVTITNLDASYGTTGYDNAYVYENCTCADLSIDYHANITAAVPLLSIGSAGTITFLKTTGTVTGGAASPCFLIAGPLSIWNVQMSSSLSTSSPFISITSANSPFIQMTGCNIQGSNGVINDSGGAYPNVHICNSTYSGSAAVFTQSGGGHLTYALSGLAYPGTLSSGSCQQDTGYNFSINSLTASGLVTADGLQDTTSANWSAPMAEDSAGNLTKITIGTGLTYNTSTKTLTASGGSYSAGTGLTLSGTTFSLTSPVSVANGGTGATSFTSGDIIIGSGTSALTVLAPGTGVATGLAANVNSSSGFVTQAGGDARYGQLAATNAWTGSNGFSSRIGANGGITVPNGQYSLFRSVGVGYGNDNDVAFLNASNGIITWGGTVACISETSGGIAIGASGTAGDTSGQMFMAGITLGGGTEIKGIKIITGTLASGAATLSDASITTTSAIIPTHLGSSVTNAGPLFAYPTGSGTGAVKSTNGSDNDTFTAMVVNH